MIFKWSSTPARDEIEVEQVQSSAMKMNYGEQRGVKEFDCSEKSNEDFEKHLTALCNFITTNRYNVKEQMKTVNYKNVLNKNMVRPWSSLQKEQL